MSQRSISKRNDWEQMEKEVAALIRRLRRKPNKLGFQCSPGGILNAYREGNVTFDKAVKELEAWKDRKVRDTILELRHAHQVLKAHDFSQKRKARLKLGI